MWRTEEKKYKYQLIALQYILAAQEERRRERELAEAGSVSPMLRAALGEPRSRCVVTARRGGGASSYGGGQNAHGFSLNR